MVKRRLEHVKGDGKERNYFACTCSSIKSRVIVMVRDIDMVRFSIKLIDKGFAFARVFWNMQMFE